MSVRLRKTGTTSSGVADDSIVAKLLEMSTMESKRNAHLSMAAVRDVSTSECCTTNVSTDLHQAMDTGPLHYGATGGFLDGAKKAAERKSKGKDQPQSLTFLDTLTSDQTPIKMPLPLFVYYKHLLNQPFNPESDKLVNENFFKDWTSEPPNIPPFGNATIGAHLENLKKKFNNLTWTTKKFYETKAADDKPTRTFVHIGMVSGELKKDGFKSILRGDQHKAEQRFKDVIAIDVHTLELDYTSEQVPTEGKAAEKASKKATPPPKGGGTWKIKSSAFAADWLSAVKQSSL